MTDINTLQQQISDLEQKLYYLNTGQYYEAGHRELSSLSASDRSYALRNYIATYESQLSSLRSQFNILVGSGQSPTYSACGEPLSPDLAKKYNSMLMDIFSYTINDVLNAFIADPTVAQCKKDLAVQLLQNTSLMRTDKEYQFQTQILGVGYASTAQKTISQLLLEYSITTTNPIEARNSAKYALEMLQRADITEDQAKAIYANLDNTSVSDIDQMTNINTNVLNNYYIVTPRGEVTDLEGNTIRKIRHLSIRPLTDEQANLLSSRGYDVDLVTMDITHYVQGFNDPIALENTDSIINGIPVFTGANGQTSMDNQGMFDPHQWNQMKEIELKENLGMYDNMENFPTITDHDNTSSQTQQQSGSILPLLLLLGAAKLG